MCVHVSGLTSIRSGYGFTHFFHRTGWMLVIFLQINGPFGFSITVVQCLLLITSESSIFLDITPLLSDLICSKQSLLCFSRYFILIHCVSIISARLVVHCIVNIFETRMHSSRMRTGRSLTICLRCFLGGGESPKKSKKKSKKNWGEHPPPTNPPGLSTPPPCEQNDRQV